MKLKNKAYFTITKIGPFRFRKFKNILSFNQNLPNSLFNKDKRVSSR